jgi:serine/threonine protein kinase
MHTWQSLKPLLKFLLTALDYLHTKCDIIHTGTFVSKLRGMDTNVIRPDLTPENILLGIENDGIISELIKDEEKNPTPVKVYDDRRIYPSQFRKSKRTPGSS